MIDERDNKIEDRRLDDRFSDVRAFPRGRGAGEREDAGADNGADPEAGQVESVERALHLALRRLRLANQKLRALGLEKFRCHECPPVISLRM